MTSTWYGSTGVDDRLARAHKRVKEIVADLNKEQRCVNCRGIFNPLEEIGQRSCSLHPMPVQHGATSATDYIQAEGTSRVSKNHFGCCGSSKTPENPLSSRDLNHEYYKSYEGCTRSDHIGSWGWTSLLGHNNNKHNVAFDRFEGGDTSTQHSKHWLYVYPILFVQLLATLRKGARELVSAQEAIQMVLGSNVLVFNEAKDVLQTDPRMRRKEIKAGTRTLVFDACLAYIYMIDNLGLPKDILTNESCRIIANQVHQQAHPQTRAGAGDIFKEPDPFEDISFDPMILDAPVPTVHVKSESALNKAMALIGMRSSTVSSASGMGRGAATGSGRTSSSPHSTSSSLSAAPKQTAFQILHSQVFGNTKSMDRDSGTNLRDDLYSMDADQLLRESRSLSSANILNVSSGRRFDLAQFYTNFISPAFATENDGVFFPFVVAPWMDITSIPRRFEEDGAHQCHIVYDMTRFSPYV